MHIKNFLRILLISTVAYLVTYCNSITADKLPDTGEPSTTLLSTKETKRLGREFMREVRTRMSLLEDPIINDYIRTLGKKLIAHTKDTKRNLNFFIINNDICNAFAGPGANIGINSGVILTANSTSELTAIIAHEVAHVTLHHIELLIETIKYSSLAATVGIIAAMIIGQTYGASTNAKPFPSLSNTTPHANNNNISLPEGIAMATVGGIAQHVVNFTREQEIAADYMSTKLLSHSGFDTQAMPRIFTRIQQQHGNTQNIPQSLLTHPKLNTRIAEAQNRVQSSPGTTLSEETFNLIRMRTLVLTAKDLPKVIRTLYSTLQQQKNSAVLNYGYALALYRNSQLEPALQIATQLQATYPHIVLYQMLVAKLLVKNSPNQALTILETALSKHKDYYPLILQYAQTLLITNKPQAARDLLRDISITYTENANLYFLLAQAYAANGQQAEAYQTQTDAYALQEHYRKALLLLQQAAKIPKLSTNNRAIIDAKIKQYKVMEKGI